MSIFLKRNFIIIVAMTLLFASSCTRNVKEMKLANENAKFKLIIAGDSSEYKDAIREDIISRYKKTAGIEVMNIEYLDTISEESYDVILIMDTCMAWGAFNPTVNRYLENAANKDNIVLFMTAGDPELEYSHEGVDAISSASVVENKEDVTAKLFEKIDGIISGI
jgi:hypothetical protein